MLVPIAGLIVLLAAPAMWLYWFCRPQHKPDDTSWLVLAVNLLVILGAFLLLEPVCYYLVAFLLPGTSFELSPRWRDASSFLAFCAALALWAGMDRLENRRLSQRTQGRF